MFRYPQVDVGNICIDCMKRENFAFRAVSERMKPSLISWVREVGVLVSFTFENWKSYRGPAGLSMVAGRGRSHAGTLIPVPGYRGLSLLPVAGIWGGNAGGKTNILDALRFVKAFVTGEYETARGGIPVRGFRPGSPDDPTRFSIVFIVDGRMWLLEFSLTRSGVIDEALYWHTKDGIGNSGWRNVYSRTTDGGGDAVVELQPVACPELPGWDAELCGRLAECAKGTGPYRLFLSNTVGQRIPVFAHLYGWFDSTLRYAGADTQYTRFSRMLTDERYCRMFGEILRALDTGVDRVGLEDAPASEIERSMDPRFRARLESDGDTMYQLVHQPLHDITDAVYLVAKKDGNISVRRVQTYRRRPDGTEERFGFENESSGTRRLLEVLPVFTDLWSGDTECVWLLDEIDKEFHTDMTQALVRRVLESSGGAHARSQMIFTTHDLMLMDTDLLRADEIYIAERSRSGESSLTALSSYKGIRKDLDLRRSYLEGRFGGLPSIDASYGSEGTEE